MQNELNFKNLMNRMWDNYIQITPQAQKIYDLLKHQGEIVINDHIALRTFNHARLGIKSLSRHFVKYGYFEAGEYFFKEKKLFAKHYEHENNEFPKIFISELELEKVSKSTQEIINNCVAQISDDTINREDFIFSGKHWDINHKTYNILEEDSNYASWVYAYGFRPNHFTVNINALKNLNDITILNSFLKENNFTLNTSGGEIKGSPDEMLEQSSTMALELPVQFLDGKFDIPGCYYEFAKRYPMPDGRLYQGFIAKSADKIFESTDKIK